MPKNVNPGVIYEEPVVIKRIRRRGALEEVTGSGTVAAAVMVVAALLALVVANSPAYEAVEHFLVQPLSIGFGAFAASLTVEAFVNDFLMAVFFLLVGIELKYEMTVGQLRRPRQAALPMLAAVGGVCAPALIYLAFNMGGLANGWAVPIATDIAFALGIASLLGDKISPATKVFFQTLAIADDILAIVVIAVAYGQSPNIAWCAAAAIVVLVLWGLNRAKVYSLKPYLLVGIVLWVCMYNSGIHATLAGVILAFALPSRSDVRLDEFGAWLGQKAQLLEDRYDEDAHILGQHSFTEGALRVESVIHHVTPPLERMEHYISVPVNFLILPIFAFVNAQVHLVGTDFLTIVSDPVTIGVYLGAVLGKPLGIFLVTFVLVKIGFAKLPEQMDWVQVGAIGIMGGLGFTMSILISGLAFDAAAEVMAAKCAILMGSFTSAILGILFTNAAFALRDKKGAGEDEGASVGDGSPAPPPHPPAAARAPSNTVRSKGYPRRSNQRSTITRP
ncbi:Na+/H+ antiporter NhaA [Paratractidigestivibacter sp.]|uniref:Na+/H+ antiporter NhaA n=1 Tax=Paratractidigestivibacter sp. TaxID=2847316 RepID=UPI002AC8F04F|nr:Na+/H+ antiporter NhaA [Paratractidigestivibacter sp.]